MQRRFLAPLLLAAGSLCSGTAFAADNGVYLGGSVGRADLKIDENTDLGSLSFDGDDTAYKLIVGIRPLDWLAFEASYMDLGTPDDSVASVQLDADTSGISAFAVGFLPVGPVDMFAKAGLINWDSDLRAGGTKVLDEDGTDLAYGAGVQFRLGSLAVRGEYEVFDIEGVDDATLLSIGLTWTFL